MPNKVSDDDHAQTEAKQVSEGDSRNEPFPSTFGLRSEMVTSSSQCTPLSKLDSSAFAPSSRTSENVLGKKHNELSVYLHEDRQTRSDTSPSTSGDSDSSFSFLNSPSSGTFGSGPQPASEVHSGHMIHIPPEEYPETYKLPQYDAVLVCSESDKNLSVKIKYVMERFLMLEDGRPPRLCLLNNEQDDLISIQSEFEKLDVAMERSTFMLLLITKAFVNDTLASMHRDECLMQTLNDPDKRWCLVPLHTKKKKDVNYKIPYGLRSLKGIDLWNMLKDKDLKETDPNEIERSDLNKIFIENLTKLFNLRLCKKLERERRQQDDLDAWLDQEMARRRIKLMEQQRRKHILNSSTESSMTEEGSPQHHLPFQNTNGLSTFSETWHGSKNCIKQQLNRAGQIIHEVLSPSSQKSEQDMQIVIHNCGIMQIGHHNVLNVMSSDDNTETSSLSTDINVVEISEERMDSDDMAALQVDGAREPANENWLSDPGETAVKTV